jgi:hypothetical protein
VTYQQITHVPQTRTKFEKSLPDLAAAIQYEHDAASRALRSAVVHAIEAGNYLIEAKQQLKHGAWLPWLKNNCEIPERTVQAYMRLARLPVEKRNAVADLPLRDALSAIRSREERNARAEERINSSPTVPAHFLFPTADGKFTSIPGPNLVIAPEHRHLIPPALPVASSPTPPTADEIADELVRQLMQAWYGVRDQVSVEVLRAAFIRRFGEIDELGLISDEATDE